MALQTNLKPLDGINVNHLVLPPIYVVIPSKDGGVEALLPRLDEQSYQPDIVEVIKGVQPNGLARNIGVSAVEGNLSTDEDCVLVFIDDDAIPGSPTLIESLVRPLVEDRSRGDIRIGITGSARVLPDNASWFQRRAALEIPRTVNDVPKSPKITNPPLKGYGHSLITTTCCAMWLSTYMEAGRFSEELTSGVDTDFFHRVRQLGYEFIMVANDYIEHPAPANLDALFRKYYWYGLGYGQEVQQRPEQQIGPRLPTLFHRFLFLLVASLWVLPNVIILYSFSYPRLELGFRPLKALSTYAVAWGYTRAWNISD